MLPLAEFSRQPAGLLLSRRRPEICGLAEFKPKMLSRPEIYSKPVWYENLSGVVSCPENI